MEVRMSTVDHEEYEGQERGLSDCQCSPGHNNSAYWKGYEDPELEEIENVQ
jgi:hypothetical protein